MALPVSWKGDGLSPGTLSSTSAGPGDTPLGSLAGGASVTIDSSGSTPPRIRFAAGAANLYAGWNSTALGTISAYVVSAYVEFGTIASAQWAILAGSIGSTVQWRLDVTGTTNSVVGRLRLRSGTAQVAESSESLAAATLYRMEVVGNGSSITVTFYAGTSSTVAAGPITGTATSGSIDNVRFGNFSSSTTPPVQFFDDLSVASPVATITGAAALVSASTLAVDASVTTPVDGTPLPPAVGVSSPPPGRPTFFVAVRDENLARVAAITPTALTFTPRYNDVGEWSLQVPADAPGASFLRAAGAGVLIYRGDDMALLMSGPVGTRRLTQTDAGLALEVSGPDDNVWISSRLAYQMPSRTVPNQGTPTTGALTHDRRSGAAESVVKQYVDANLGQSAQVERRVVTVAPVASTPRGSVVTGAARMTPLLDLIRGLAATGGIGFGVKQVGTALVFDVYVPTDRTGTARFSSQLGNLESFEFSETAPSASYVVSGGQGQGIARAFAFTEDAPALVEWPRWRMERFVDQRQAEDAAEILQARLEELVTNGPQTSLSITTRDTAQTQFGRDFFIGDRVTVEPVVGAVVKEVLREVTVTWTPERTSVVSRVGTAETTGTSRIIRALRRLTSKSAAVNTVE